MPGEGVVTKIAAAKQAQDDVRDVDYASDAFTIAQADEEGTVRWWRHVIKVNVKLLRSGWCSCPRMVQRTAPANRRQKLALISNRWGTKIYPGIHRRTERGGLEFPSNAAMPDSSLYTGMTIERSVDVTMLDTIRVLETARDSNHNHEEFWRTVPAQ